MFEKFTERARKILSLSRREAQVRNNEFISTEHMLIAILREGGGVAAKALNKMGLNLANVTSEIDKIAPVSTKPATQLSQLPFSPRMKNVLELADEEASREGQEVVGTEHLLIGLFLEKQGAAAQIFTKFDVTEQRLRKELRKIFGEDIPRTVSPSVPVPISSIKVTLYGPSEGTIGMEFLVIQGVKYNRVQSITVNGVPLNKRESVAQAIATDMGCNIYVVEPIS